MSARLTEKELEKIAADVAGVHRAYDPGAEPGHVRNLVAYARYLRVLVCIGRKIMHGEEVSEQDTRDLDEEGKAIVRDAMEGRG